MALVAKRRLRTTNVTLPVGIVQRLVNLHRLDPDNWDDRDAQALRWAESAMARAREAAQQPLVTVAGMTIVEDPTLPANHIALRTR